MVKECPLGLKAKVHEQMVWPNVRLGTFRHIIEIISGNFNVTTVFGEG